MVRKVEEVSAGKGQMVVAALKGKEKVIGTKKWEPTTKEKADVSRLVYTSSSEDRLWFERGMVAKLIMGDSSLSVQQRVEDAGFNNVVVTPMGSDKVFIHGTGGADIWNIFNEAPDFFGMLFSDKHKWLPEADIYERGAWIRIYGTPPFAWNESFFNIVMSGCGRYIRSDECTLDKARLDFARVLISTQVLEIINSSIEVFIDGQIFLLKLVEEWGCNLGEDAFLSEDVSDSRTEALSHQNDAPGMEDYQGDLDALVDDLSND